MLESPHLRGSVISHRYNQLPSLCQQLCSPKMDTQLQLFPLQACTVSSRRADSADHRQVRPMLVQVQSQQED